jgi:mono/diheme cytochrome c family protein
MSVGVRRLAVTFAITILLASRANLLPAATTSNTSIRIVTADNSESANAGVHNKPNKVVITPEARAQAADIFESRCVACHGLDGHGDGPAAANLNPRPRDFHDPKWQKSIDDTTIARAIVSGGQAVGVSVEMAANPDLEDEPAVVAALVEHVRGLGR